MRSSTPRTKSGFAALTFLLSCTSALTARANGSARDTLADVEWIAPTGCPTEAEVSKQVQVALGSGMAGRERAHARAIAMARGELWQADVTVAVGQLTSTRHIEGETCRAVADAVAVIVTLAVNPPGPPASPSPPVVGVAAVAPQRRPIDDRPHPRGDLVLGASFMLDVGTLPLVGVGAEALVGWSLSRLQLEIAGGFLGPARATLSDRPLQPPQGATFWLAEVGGRACYLLFGGALDVGPCLGGGAQFVLARGFGSTSPKNADDPIGIVTPGAEVVARFSPRAAVRLAGGPVIPFTRPTFIIDNGGTLYQSPAVAARATLGVEVDF